MLEDAIEFYYKAIELKDMIRQEPIKWHVDKQRLESIAEHTFGSMILAIAIHSELGLGLGMEKVLTMLTIHELEELEIGDITPLDVVDKKEMEKRARKAVVEMVESLQQKDRLISLTDEFNEEKTPEAKFARAIDKFECILQFKKYNDLGQASLSNIPVEKIIVKEVQDNIKSGKYDIADIFYLYSKEHCEELGVDEKFWFEVLKSKKCK